MTHEQIAAHLDLSITRVRQHLAKGVIPRGATLDTIRVAYIRHLRAEQGGATPERRRLDTARAASQEFKTERERGEWVPAAELDRALVVLSTTISARIQALPSELAPELAAASRPADCQRILDAAITEALNDLADQADDGDAVRNSGQ